MIKGRPELEWTPEMVARFWDYESNFPERFFTYLNGAEMVRQLQPYFHGKASILDYGCGPGYLLDQLLAAGIQTAGMDFSAEAMQKVNERLQGHPHFLGTFTPHQLEESGRRFDAICVVEVIEHLYDEPLGKLLDDVGKFLAPDGIVIFTTPNEEDLEKSSLLCPATGEVFHRWQHVRSWSKAGLSSYLEGLQRARLLRHLFRPWSLKGQEEGSSGSPLVGAQVRTGPAARQQEEDAAPRGNCPAPIGLGGGPVGSLVAGEPRWPQPAVRCRRGARGCPRRSD
jgi:2-polyprenyl-3-methyl-5-hydroxy-6-metoxy-1,4-benzoquinol methylase